MRAIIVHGWRGYSEKGWLPWLKRELETRGFEVSIPQLPPSDKKINIWVRELESSVGTPDDRTFLVGHSIGCQTIVRYLERLPEGVKIGGIVFVAGFLKPIRNHSDMREINENWVAQPLNFKKVKMHFDKSVAIFSDDDPYISLDNQSEFKDKLGSEIVIEHKHKHLIGEPELPSVLNAVLKISTK